MQNLRRPLLCAAAVSSLLLAGCSKKQAGAGGDMAAMMAMEVPVRVATANATDVPLTLSAVGTTEAISSVDVKSRVAGQIVRVDFREGDNVAQGQLLFEIDPEPLQRQIAELQANIGKDQAQEAQSKANVARDQAQLKQARASADRGLALSKDGIYSKEQTEQVVATADAAQAAVEADQAAIESAVAAQKADAAKLAETQLQLTYCRITAPIAGRAGAVQLKAGNLVKDNDATLVSILQLSPIDISFGVAEQYLDQIRQNNAHHPLLVKATASGQEETGHLVFIDNSADATTGTVKLKAEFDNHTHTLWPGAYTNVSLQMDLEHDRIVVPSRTVQTGPTGRYVWVVDSSGKADMRPVNVARLYQPGQGEEEAVIASGLQSGDKVVTEGQMRLAPGSKVRLLDASSHNGNDQAAPIAGE